MQLQKPKVSELIQYRLPDWISSKPQFVNFIKYYYEWLETKGNPLEFLRNLVEYSDIDEAPSEFDDLIINKIISFVPADSAIDRTLLVKNVKAFLRAKGSEESLNFIMKAVYNEEAYRVNMTDHVIRASDNESDQFAYIAIEIFDSINHDFYDCVGSYLVQLEPAASVRIEDSQYRVTDDGRMFNVIKFDPRYINGEFNIGREVRAIKKIADPTFFEITEYSTAIGFDIETKSIRFLSDKNLRLYVGQLIFSLDGGFRGVISSLGQYFINSNNKHDYTIGLSEYSMPIVYSNDVIGYFDDYTLTVTSALISNLAVGQILSGDNIIFGTYISEILTGSGGVGTYKVSKSQTLPSSSFIAIKTITLGEEVYLCTLAAEDSHITKNNFSYGKVSNSIGDFEHTNPASGYYENMHVEVRGGNGKGCDAYIGETTTGGVDSIIIIDGGSNYRVGDPIEITEKLSGGYGFDAYVNNTDGFGGKLDAIMQIDSIIINNGGYAYSVGDTFQLPILNNLLGSPITLTVSSVATAGTPTLKGFKILNSGKGYRTAKATLVSYNNITVVDGVITASITTIVPITGLSLEYYTVNNNRTEQYSINASPVNFADAIIDVKPTIFPAPHANLGTSANGSTNAYLVFNGFGASFTSTVGSGIITEIAVAKGGYAYVDPVIQISDTSGKGATAKAIKDANGVITSIVVLSGGSNYSGSPQIRVYDRSGEGFIAQAICNTTLLGTISGFTALVGNAKGEFNSLPESSEHIPYSPASTVSGNGLVLSLTYSVKRLLVTEQGYGYSNPQTYYACSSSNGSNIITTTLDFDNVQVGMYVSEASGTIIPARARIVSIGYTTGVPKTITLDKTLSNTVSEIIVDKNIIISKEGIGNNVELFPVIEDGRLENVVITNSGNDYSSNSVITFSGGTIQAAANLIVRNGKIVEVDMTAYGTGYTENNFAFEVNSTAGAYYQKELDALVHISGTGAIISVDVISGGRGYVAASTKLYIEGSSNTDATLTVDIETGVDVLTVESLGKEGAFTVSYTDRWLSLIDSSGIMQTVQLKTQNILDTGAGSGGVVSFYINPNGKLATNKYGVAWMWVSSAGTNYTAPYLNWSGNYPVIKLGSTKRIKKVNVISGGSGYDPYTEIFVVGVGAGCQLAPMIDGSSGVSSVDVLATALTNKGYTKYPTLLVDDISNFGKISEIKIKNPGTGFKKFPGLRCELYRTTIVLDSSSGSSVTTIKYTGPTNDRPNPAMGAKLLAVSSTIGGIKKLDQENFGYGYDEIPEVLYPVSMIVKNAENFRLNEKVSHTGFTSSQIGTHLVSIKGNDNSDVEITFDDSPYGYGINIGQTLTLSSSTDRFDYDVTGKIFTVHSINSFAKTVSAYTTALIPDNTYTLLLPDKLDSDLILENKAAKIIGIDTTRNMLWISNLDNIYDYSEEVSYLAEGTDDDGKVIVSENFNSISDNKKLIGHESQASSEILWMNRAASTPKQTSIGKSKKFFKSGRGLLNSSSMFMTNSLDVQDFCYEVHSGYGKETYSNMLKNTVHPAGYYLSGVIDDVTDTTLFLENRLNPDLPLLDFDKKGDFVYLAIIGTLASLFLLKNYRVDTKERYKNRLSESMQMLDYSFNMINGNIPSFEMWNYPNYNVWYNKAETDEQDYHIWGSNSKVAEIKTTQNITNTCVYTQTGYEITFDAPTHGLLVGDTFKVFAPNKYKDRGTFFLRLTVSYFIDDMVLYSGVLYRCTANYTTNGNEFIEATAPSASANWTVCEGNISDYIFIVSTVTNANSFKALSRFSSSATEATQRPYQKVTSAVTVSDFTRTNNLVTVTSTDHGLTSGINSWVYAYFKTAGNEFTASYSVTGTTTSVNITYNNHGYSNGDKVYVNFVALNSTPATIPVSGEYAVSGVGTHTFTITNPTSLSTQSGAVFINSRSDTNGRYFNVTSVPNANTFVIDVNANGHALIAGEKINWIRPEKILPKFDRQITLRDVAFEVSGLNIEISGLDNHNLSVGTFLMLSFNNTKVFSKITAKTINSITVAKGALTTNDILDITFNFDQIDVPEVAYRSLTSYTYPTFL